jgi:hypothetical protein
VRKKSVRKKKKTMAEKNTKSSFMTGKEFFEINSKEKLTLKTVKQLTRENINSFEVSILNYVMTLSEEEKVKYKDNMIQVREFGFRNCQLLYQHNKMEEEMGVIDLMLLGGRDAEKPFLEDEKMKLEMEIEETKKQGLIVNGVLETLFKKLIIILTESFGK